MGNMGNYGTKRIGHLVIHSSTQKGNFNFAIKISKKLLAFGINWLLICRFYHEASELGVSQCQSLSDSQFICDSNFQSVILSLCLSIILSVSQLVCQSVKSTRL